MSEEKTYMIGSLFAGIGGFDLGFERAGFKTAWQVEIDPYCQKVLAKNFPEAERFGDIRECGSHNLKPVDVICGGFPCQDISNAGLRVGIEGERSGLWKHYARIIRELRPRFVVVENVAALLGRGMGVVLGDLAKIGYDAEWRIIPASEMGAPHRRERVWIVAYPQHDRLSIGWGNEASGASCFELFGVRGDVRQGSKEQARSELANPHKVNGERIEHGSNDALVGQEQGERQIGLRSRGWPYSQWEIEPNVGRVAHGVPKRVDRLRGLGNAVVPQIPEMIARRIKHALES
jgi:DNA (cytosine-5)-methyltransferase 1